ncbi:B12-binding domain-containing radical SAM protein [bacterium]|nr:B12-binding domain-containing radical SAM protein [candidate division CSSED10-310 bacterium]
MNHPDETYRVLLIRPPYTRLRGTGQAPYFPLGIGSMAAVLNAEPGIEARLYYADNPGPGERPVVVDKEGVFASRSEAQRRYFAALDRSDHPVWKEIREVITAFRPNMVGLSVLTPEVGSALCVTAIARDVNPDVHVVWGGVHATFEPLATRELPGVASVVMGEGEETIRDLVRAVRAGTPASTIPGVLSTGSPPDVPAPRPLISDLNTVPLPDRQAVFFPDRFTPVAMGSLMHSRGCPWRCGFCSSRRFWHERVRFRSAENVMEEIMRVHRDYGIRIFTFWDDAFTIDRRLTERLCEAIIRSGVKIAWRTATRLDLLDDDMLKLMRRAGCVQMDLGIETGSPRMSSIIRKDIDLDAAPDTIDRANRHGIAAGVFLMAGFPDETREDLMQTYAFMQRIRPAEIVLNILDPMPGSEQFERAVELGILKQPVDYARFPLWPDAHFVRDIEPVEFNRLIEEISSYVFKYNSSRTAVIRRARPEILQLLRTDRRVLLQKALRFVRRRLHRGTPR